MEKDTQRKIIKHLESLGCYVFKVIIGNRNGIPDIICCKEGKFTAIEVKSKGKQPTPLQRLNLELIKKAGGLSLVADDFEEFKKAIEDIIKTPT